MPTTEMLTVIAEISVAFAGFGALIAIFVGRRSEAPRLDDFPQFWFMIELSLVTLFASLIPLLFQEIDIERAWSCSSIALAPLLAGYGIRIMRARRATPTSHRLPMAYIAVVYGVGVAVVLILIANAAALLPGSQAWPYLVTLLWLLVGVATNFLRFLRILASRV